MGPAGATLTRAWHSSTGPLHSWATERQQVVVVAGDVVGVHHLRQPDHRTLEGDDVRASVPDAGA
jgi:hypothetical protein